MPPIKVNVKWGKKFLFNVDLDTDLEPSEFRDTLFKLTGVHPARQKILIKGIIIKDSWEIVNILPNCTVLLMGTEGELPSKPEREPVFLEDMTESELAKTCNLPPGLVNLGNTCYINATLQCFRTVPELLSTLKLIKGNFSFDPVSKQSIMLSLRDQFEQMDKGMTSAPLGIIHCLHKICPHLSEKDSNGNWKQQDANEFWLQILNFLQETLRSPLKQNDTSFVNQYFSGTFEIEYKCTETDREPVVKNGETFLQLSCFISQGVKFMQSGLESKLVEEVVKHSVVLNHDAVFKKICKISRLPAYLTVQFVRFFYKEKEKLNAKILKEVQFPIQFDVYDLCSEELKKKLGTAREQIKQLESSEPVTLKENSKNEPSNLLFSFEDDEGSSNSGLYQLYAVLTHKGRSSSSGHYVAWVYQNATWFKCDDSDITAVKEQDILRLSGGGDSHCAYILLYGPRNFN